MQYHAFRTRLAPALALAFAGAVQAGSAVILGNPASAPESFAIQEIEQALKGRRIPVARHEGPASFPLDDEVLIYFDPLNGPRAVVQDGDPATSPADEAKIAAEGFSLRHARRGRQHVFRIVSRDAGGAMYGGLEAGE